MKNKIVKSENYNSIFNAKTGMFMRWGKTVNDDPDYCEIGPEILDIEISEVCHQGCKFCLIPGEKILTQKGEIQIEDLKIGDIVYSFDELKKIRVENTIEQVFERNYDGKVIKVYLENGRTITCTPNHKIYTTNRGWIPAENITEDDDVVDVVISVEDWKSIT